MIKLKSKYNCQGVYDEINPLIKEILEIRTENGTYHTKYALQMEEFENIFFNYLFEKTDLKKKLNSLKMSSESINYLDIFNKIDSEDNYFEKFLELLNKELEKFEETELKEYTFLFTTNLKELGNVRDSESAEKECNLDNRFKMVLDLFNLNLIEKIDPLPKDENNYYKVPLNEKLLDIVSRYNGEVLSITIQARNDTYALEEANLQFEAFLGFLSFVINRFSKGYNKYYNGSNFRLFNIKTEHIFLFVNDDDENDRYNIPYHDIAEDYINELKSLKLIDLNKDLKFQKRQVTCKGTYNAVKQLNRKWSNITCTLFSLYYLATNENKLDYSLLKFWVISDYLLKIHGKKTDDQMLKLIEKVVKIFNNDPYLSKRIYFLYEKRNNLVHKGEMNNINQSDRYLSKMIADSILSFYLFFVTELKLKNIGDFDFLITNFGKTEKTLKHQSDILNNLEQWKRSEKEN